MIYDNQMGSSDSADPSTALGGGSIVIHTTGGAIQASLGRAGGETSNSLALPLEYALSQNHPNPFNRSTQMRFSLPQRTQVRIAIYDILGREVRTLVDEEREPGSYVATWSGERSDGSSARGGIYFVRMRACVEGRGAAFVTVKKVIMVR